MVGLASHEKIFSGCCSRHKSTHPLTFILNRLITSAAVCCAVQAECVHSLLGVTAAIVSLCSKGFCTWMSVVLATIAGSLILIHSNSMQKGFVCTTSAGFNTNFLPKGFQGIIKTVFHCVSPSCWCPAATCLTPPLAYLSFSDWPYTFQSCHFSLFSTFLSCLTRAIWTSSSDNTNSTCAPPQHHTDWYSAQLPWISPSICSNQSHSASLPLRVCRGVAEIYLGVDMRFTVEIKMSHSFYCAWFDIFVCYCISIKCKKVQRAEQKTVQSIMLALVECPKIRKGMFNVNSTKYIYKKKQVSIRMKCCFY